MQDASPRPRCELNVSYDAERAAQIIATLKIVFTGSNS
jgi:hypothetical protein